jgi:hypothetical protein
VEVGSNTSIVDLRIVGDGEKGSLESEKVNYGHEFHGTHVRPENDCAGEDQQQL